MNIVLISELKALTGGYSEEAPNNAAYPYNVFSVNRISEENGIQTYNLEINVWDDNQYYSRADSYMDDLEKKLHGINHLTEKILIQIWKGQRRHIPDQDKQIKRVREIFEMKVCERREEFI